MAYSPRNDRQKKVGELIGSVFVKRVDSRKHKFKKADAYAIDTAIIENLRDKGCDEVEVRETDTGCRWNAPLSEFQEHGFEKDFGHGKQTFLARRYWKVTVNK